MVDFSIVICTHNPPENFRETLSALQSLDCQGLTVELVVVDNSSEVSVRDEFKQSFLSMTSKFSIIHTVELQPGLAYARRCGVNSSTGNYIVFCDDDNILAKDYLQIAHAIFVKYTNVGAVGGRSELPFSSSLSADILRLFAVGSQQAATGYCELNYLWGAGLAMRRHVATLAVNLFEPLCIGRTSEKIETGDDGELCIYIQSLGYKLFYTEKLKFIHNISENRLTHSNIIKLRKEMRKQINFRIIKFIYNLHELKLQNIKYLVYCLMRPHVVIEVIRRMKKLRSMRLPI